MPLFTRTTTNPIFYPDQLELLLGGDRGRLERMRTEPGNTDLMTWNIFASLDTHDDPDWLAYRLQQIGGPNLRAPVRISLFSGGRRAPHLRPSTGYVRALHARTGIDPDDEDDDSIAAFKEPVEVSVRIETPDVLLLVDTGRQRLRAGAGGRERFPEIVDAGLEHARRLSSRLSVGLILDDDSALLSRVPHLATAAGIAEQLPWRDTLPRVDVHGTPWSTVLAIWADEAHRLNLGGQPVKAFRSYATTPPS